MFALKESDLLMFISRMTSSPSLGSSNGAVKRMAHDPWGEILMLQA